MKRLFEKYSPWPSAIVFSATLTVIALAVIFTIYILTK